MIKVATISLAKYLTAVKDGDMSTVEKAGGRWTVSKAQNGELSGATGGYTLPIEFSDKILFALAERGLIASRSLMQPMGSLTTRAPMLDATTVQAAGTTPFFGGLKFGWGPGITLTNGETEPQFSEQTLTAWDLIGYGIMSNQWLQDSGPIVEKRLIKLLSEAAMWYAEYAYLRGIGAGGSMPLGILNAPCALNVNRAGGNAIAIADAAGMAAKLIPMSWENVIWACSPTALAKVVQLSGYQSSTARPETQGSDCFGWLLNRPLFVTEKLPPLGTRGDLVLFDPSLYVVGMRQEVVVDVSDGVPGKFERNQSVYRVWLRGDGKPVLNGTVTLADASSTASSVVVLN